MPGPNPQTPTGVSGRHLLKSTGTVGAMTLLSRVLGLVRDMVFARLFGASYLMDAFFVAFKIPNIFRRWSAEGAFSQAFVPVFADYDQNRSHAEVKDLVDRVTGTLTALLFAITALGVVAAPLLILVFAPGFASGRADADRFALAVDMLRLTFPYLFFISLAALAGGILNTYRRFAVAAFSPVLLNITMIVFAAFVAPYYHRPGMALAAGVFAAGVVQLAFMLPYVQRIGLLPRPRWGLAHAGVRRIMSLMAPAIFGSSVAQISILFDTLIASFLVTGSISWLYYSDRLMEFPLGVFGIALATVILPNLSRQHASASREQFAATLEWAIRFVILISAPASVGLVILSGPVLATIFFGGEFSAGDVHMASLSLMAYAAGLVALTLVKVLAPGFFARQDTRTPVRVGLIALGTNMLFNVFVVVPWVWAGLPAPHAMLAASTSLSGCLNAALLYTGLRREGVIGREGSGWWRFLLRVAAACGTMALLLIAFSPPLAQWLEVGLATRCLWLGAAIGGAVIAYFATLYAVGLRVADFRMKTTGSPV
ncbi:MAG: murein biosynthesis integral membrane protein MurJ [Gammaproteobacteria bacterium]|nr:MAG: murein biosynthesis integral membrane protein MurJ [Gammaproteobacteria bacterium]